MQYPGIARATRSHWKIENETFNMLKNLGYKLEHNFGHGHQHLATVLLLVFLLDPLQELCCPLVPSRTSEGCTPQLRVVCGNHCACT